MALEDRALRYFRVVHDLGSIRAAAERLNVAPSAVSRQMAELESSLGIDLLERTPRGVRPTQAGEILARFARQTADLDRLLSEELDRLRGLERGFVRLASGEGFVYDLVTNGLSSFLSRHPGIQVSLETAGTRELAERLLRDEAEIGVVYHAQHHPELTILAQAPQPLCLVCRTDHPLATGLEPEAGPLAPEVLTGHRAAVLSPGFGIRMLVDQLQAHHAVNLDVQLVTTSVQAIQGFVLNGLGIGLLPRFVVGHYLAEGALRAITLTSPVMDSVQAQLLVRRGRPLSHAARSLAQHLATRLDALSVR